MRGRGAATVFAVLVTVITALAPAIVGAVLLGGTVVSLACWVAWRSLAFAEDAVDDRADLVPRPVRELPRLPVHRLPAPPRLPMPRLPPPPVLPGPAVVVPGGLRSLFKSQDEKGLDH